MRKVEVAAEAERAASVETGKPKEAVARARCWKGSLLRGLQGTGEPLIRFSWEYAADPNFSSSEILILPWVTFLVVAIYACIAIHFYNSDG